MLFKSFFVVSGKGVSKNSSLMAFDKALVDAGIAQCNLVQVSSILPSGAKEINPADIKPGTITFTVLSREDGLQGKEITAGVAWARCKMDGRDTYGLVVEDHGKKTMEECKRDLKIKLEEMADARKMEIIKYSTEISNLKDIPEKSFGCVVSALIYASEG